MSALGDVIYILGILIPALGIYVRNYMLNLVAFVMGTIAFLVFVEGYTDIAFSASTFYLAFLPLAFGLLNLAYFFNWVKEDYI